MSETNPLESKVSVSEGQEKALKQELEYLQTLVGGAKTQWENAYRKFSAHGFSPKEGENPENFNATKERIMAECDSTSEDFDSIQKRIEKIQETLK